MKPLKKNIRVLIGGLIGGSVGGLISTVLIDRIITNVGIPLNKASYQPLMIILWGALIGLGLGLGIFLNQTVSTLSINKRFLQFSLYTAGGAVTGALGSLITNGTLRGGSLLGGIVCFYLSFALMMASTENGAEFNVKYWLKFAIGGVVGGILAGLTGGAIWGILGKGAHAEGYVLLVVAMLSILCICWGTGSLFGIRAFGTTFFTKAKIFATLALIVSLMGFAIVPIRNGENKVVNVDMVNNAGIQNVNNMDFSGYDRNRVIDFLEQKNIQGLSELTALFVLTKKRELAFKIKKILLEEAGQKKYTNPAHSVKSGQMDAALRAVSYLELAEVEGLFSHEEREHLIDWFKDIVQRIFTVEWVDYLYAAAFRRAPAGPYENQEIGVGALAVLARAIEESYPALAQKCRRYIDRHAVGWGRNYRNTDDHIGYQGWWIYSCFLVAKYGSKTDWLTSKNARRAFDWILLQSPPNGMTPGYHEYMPINLADTMALGASLFHNGNYKWLANKMLRQLEIGNYAMFPFYFGLPLWNDSLEPEEPSTGSTYLVGPGELPHRPGPPRPDKIIFREGWKEDSFYALLNCRFSGWHKYKATNTLGNISYGKPFVVEDLIAKRNKWLPSGRSIYRDKKIDRARLNGFQVGLQGYEFLIYELLTFGTPWAQDPPQYSDIDYFEKTSKAVFSKTDIHAWRNWTHNRIAILEKDKYFAVFDRAAGKKKRKVAINWHLKGSSEFAKNKIRLNQDRFSLTVFYPHMEDWYEVTIEDSKESDPPAVDPYAPELDIFMISDGKIEAGFMTIFVPERSINSYNVETLSVTNLKGGSAHPYAMGVRIDNGKNEDILGVSFSEKPYRYGSVVTNSKLFILRKQKDNLAITYKDGSFLEFSSPTKPRLVKLNGQRLQEKTNWKHANEQLQIELQRGTHEIKVVY